MTASTTTAPIREATDSDLPRLMELYFQLSQSGERPDSTVYEPVESHVQALCRLTSDPKTRVLVIEDQSRVVGTLTLYVLPNLTHGGRPAAIVENLVVDESLRGGGYGRQLMDFAVRTADEAGCYKVALTSNNKRPAAHAFYQAIGFGQTHKGFTAYFDQG